MLEIIGIGLFVSAVAYFLGGDNSNTESNSTTQPNTPTSNASAPNTYIPRDLFPSNEANLIGGLNDWHWEGNFKVPNNNPLAPKAPHLRGLNDWHWEGNFKVPNNNPLAPPPNPFGK